MQTGNVLRAARPIVMTGVRMLVAGMIAVGALAVSVFIAWMRVVGRVYVLRFIRMRAIGVVLIRVLHIVIWLAGARRTIAVHGLTVGRVCGAR